MFFLLWIYWMNEPTWPAKLTRQADPPKCLAVETIQIHTRMWHAKFTSQRSPLPRSRSPGRTQLASLPPPSPHGSVSGAGEGVGSRPGPPTHLVQVLLLSLTCLHILTGHNIYAFYIERIIITKCIALGEGRIARKGWGAGLLPAPLKGVFCIIWNITGGQQALPYWRG